MPNRLATWKIRPQSPPVQFSTMANQPSFDGLPYLTSLQYSSASSARPISHLATRSTSPAALPACSAVLFAQPGRFRTHSTSDGHGAHCRGHIRKARSGPQRSPDCSWRRHRGPGFADWQTSHGRNRESVTCRSPDHSTSPAGSRRRSRCQAAGPRTGSRWTACRSCRAPPRERRRLTAITGALPTEPTPHERFLTEQPYQSHRKRTQSTRNGSRDKSKRQPETACKTGHNRYAWRYNRDSNSHDPVTHGVLLLTLVPLPCDPSYKQDPGTIEASEQEAKYQAQRYALPPY